MSKSHHRRRSRREVRARRRFVTGLILFILAIAVAIYFGAARHIPQFEPVPLSAGLTSPDTDVVPAIAQKSSEREIYPYSVIEGGASTVQELKNAMARDPVVAAHYAGFAIERTHVERLTQPRLAHVSYRIGDSVFWTRKPIALKPGETVLTDGVRIARTRCGNQLAEVPGKVFSLEPPPAALDVPLKASVPLAQTLALLQPGGQLPTKMAGLGASSTGGFPAPGSGAVPGPSLSLGTASSGGSGTETDVPEEGSPEVVPEAAAPADPGVPDGPHSERNSPIIHEGGNPAESPGGGVEVPFDPGVSPVVPEQPVPVPEPGTALLMLGGGAACAVRRLVATARRRRCFSRSGRARPRR